MDEVINRVQRGLWMLVAAAGLHVVEEFLFDWRSWVQQISGLPVTWHRFWLINALFLAFAVVCAASGLRRPVLGMALPCLVAINGVFFHIAPTLVLRRLSPGVVTSVLLYVPLSAWTILQASRTPAVTRAGLLVSGGLAMGAMAVPFVIFALT